MVWVSRSVSRYNKQYKQVFHPALCRPPAEDKADGNDKMMCYTEHVLDDAKLIYDFLADVPALPEHADFILAAGTRDLRVAAHAADLYLIGLAPVLICSGGFGKLTASMFRRPEAEQFAAL